MLQNDTRGHSVRSNCEKSLQESHHQSLVPSGDPNSWQGLETDLRPCFWLSSPSFDASRVPRMNVSSVAPFDQLLHFSMGPPHGASRFPLWFPAKHQPSQGCPSPQKEASRPKDSSVPRNPFKPNGPVTSTSLKLLGRFLREPGVFWIPQENSIVQHKHIEVQCEKEIENNYRTVPCWRAGLSCLLTTKRGIQSLQRAVNHPKQLLPPLCAVSISSPFLPFTLTSFTFD